MDKKIKVLMISDHCFSPSGVGGETKYIMEALLRSGKFQIRQFGGAIKHLDYRPMKTEEYGEDLIVFPTDNYGNPDLVRSFIRQEKPDIMWLMTDPRFFVWLFDMEDEIRPLIPIVWYTIWDNYPYPTFNKQFYLSNDYLVAISKLTKDILDHVSPEVPHEYLPHAVNPAIFKPLPEEEVLKFRTQTFRNVNDSNSKPNMDKVIFFFNSRNARRKQSSSLVWWFKDFLDIVGHDKATLIMHTDPKDVNGSDLEAIIHEQGLVNGEVLFSREKATPENLAMIYNMADCTINISDAEGFGLSCLESLSCGTPAIVTMTGGLQEQITNGEEWFGIGLKPASQCIVGSQDVPFIYEDRVSKEDFLAAMVKMFHLTRKERKEMGLRGHEHVQKNYNFEKFGQRWVDLMLEIHEKYGSWDTRKGYKKWELKEIK
jgi:glycosyltransferase involved in cell wall biosynthesis